MRPAVVLVAAAVAALGLLAAPAAAHFAIANDQFLLNSQPVQLLSGSIHYARVPPSLWADRLARLRSMGLNAIETYVPWNFHSMAAPDVYTFSGGADLGAFLTAAHDAGLMVLLRLGPYICGEWEFGGFPPYLLDPAVTPNVTLRTYNAPYLAHVDRWFAAMLAVVKPFVHNTAAAGHPNPVIMVQIENEFGSYGNVASNPLDRQYMEHLRSLVLTHLLDNNPANCIIYTTDGGNTGYMSRGTLPGGAVYTVGDFGPGSDAAASFAAQRQFNAKGMSPPMCSEFYSGWLTHWSEHQANTSSANLAKYLSQLINEYNASMSMYMGHGGTNFGFWSGANGGGGSSYQPHITSYDYDSPVSEDGTHGFGSDSADKYKAVQAVLLAAPQAGIPPPPPEPPAPLLSALAPVTLTATAPLLASLALLASSPTPLHNQTNVQPSETYHQRYGMTLYRRVLDSPVAAGTNLSIDAVRDRAHVLINGSVVDVVYRVQPHAVTLPAVSQPGATLDILVENMGRINYGHAMTDPKGIVGAGVSLGQNLLLNNWSVYALELDYASVKKLPFAEAAPSTTSSSPAGPPPAFRRGTFVLPSGDVPSTWLSMRGWTKGFVWINGNNLGRYWDPIGPQHTLFVPSEYLLAAPAKNEIIVLELHTPNATGTVEFLDAPLYYVGRPCVPAAAGAGMEDAAVSMWSADAALAPAQTWLLQGSDFGSLTLQSQTNTELCLAPGPRHDAQSGQPDTALVSCSDAGAVWSYNNSTQQLTNKASGHCLDITGHDATDGSALEIYACTPHSTNQQWVLEPVGGSGGGGVGGKTLGGTAVHLLSVQPSASGGKFYATACAGGATSRANDPLAQGYRRQ